MSNNITSSNSAFVSEIEALGAKKNEHGFYDINSETHFTNDVLIKLTNKIDELKISQSTISEQPKKSEISKNINELRTATLDILFSDYTKQYSTFAESSASKEIAQETFEAEFKSHQERLKAYIEYCQEEGLKPNQYSFLNLDVKKLAQYYVEAQNQGLAASKKLSRAEFEEVLISGNDKHSKKINFDISSNLPLNAVIIRHSNCIEKLKSPKEKIGLDILPTDQKGSFLSQVSSSIEQSFSNASKSFQKIIPDNDWGTESWTAIGNGFGFNSESTKSLGSDNILHSVSSSLGNGILTAVSSIFQVISAQSNQNPYFEEPPQWFSNLQNQTSSWFSNINQPSPQDSTIIPKPTSHDQAIKLAKDATQKAKDAAAEARQLASDITSPISRANSAPSNPKKQIRDTRIAFWGPAAKKHADYPGDKREIKNPEPAPNGPRKSTASSLDPRPSKKPRTTT